jgi:tetratricopeptide (TPR) repeat protein
MNSNFAMFNAVPGAFFSPIGGLMVWQEWMTDSLALLPERIQEGKPTAAVLLSFTNAQPLMSFNIPWEFWKIATAASAHLIVSGDLTGEQQLEGSLLKLEPLDTTGQFLAGIRAQIQGDCAGALNAYKIALAANPALPRVANLQGLCYRMLNQSEEAEKAYLREMEICPDLPDPYCNLGILYRKTGRDSLARGMFEKSLDRNTMYWNALLQFSKFILETEGPNAKLLSSLNHRLITLHHTFPQVHEQVAIVAAKLNLPLHDYLTRIRHDAGVLADPAVLAFIKRTEELRLNGAYFSALRGYALLLERTPAGSALESFLLNWIAKHLTAFEARIPKELIDVFRRIRGELLAARPALTQQGGPTPPAEISGSGRLTPEEFFALVLEAVLKDGQIKPEEMQMVFRVKNALRISEATHQAIFAQTAKKMQSQCMADDGWDFDRVRLFKTLHEAVVRDGKVEASEKKLLEIAQEALELLPEEAARFPIEITA